MYSGLTPLVVEGLDKIIIMDTRDYPEDLPRSRKRKSLSGVQRTDLPKI